MQKLDLFKEKISSASPKKIIITTHHKPDADALGSSLALASYLKKKSHEVWVVSPSDYPSFLSWMNGNDEVINFEATGNEELVEDLISQADLIFGLDFSNLDRLHDLGNPIRASKAFKVNIDHHQDPEEFADFRFCSTAAAATCELIYDLIVQVGDKELIDKDMAECLYAGIMTDTGGFRHPNTTKNIHLVTAELIGLGADNAKISRLIYDTYSVDRLKFLGFALTRRLTILPELNTAFFGISKKDLRKYNSQTGDTEGLVNYALSLDGIKIAALFTEGKDKVKISFRSSEDVSINKFAASYFKGGGHKNASGGISELSLEETVDRFQSLIKENKHILFNQLELANEKNQ
ncbi:MAG: bifunctional oligoribonuclease/PAP phosphatase NrnA [Cyclobacteriaceae bacterium]